MSVSPRMKRKISQPGRKSSGSLVFWLIGAAIIFVILIVVAINIGTSQPAVGEIKQPDLPAEWLDGSSMGNPDAKVVVEAYEDFLCPHCMEWTTTIKSQIFENYIKTGKVRFVYHTFPLSGFLPGSNMAALASQCAKDQGAFWPYHDALFSAQQGGQPAYTIDKLTSYAAQLNLDERTFTSCMSSLQHQKDIDAAMQEGIAKGVQGTPAIYINGNAVNSDYPTLQAEIERLLSAAG